MRALLADVSPAAIERALDEFCRCRLGAGIVRTEFFDVGVGSVHGLCLVDGRRVVVKLHGPRVSRSFLTAVHTVQRHLFRSDFPAPEPLVAPSAFGRGTATAETLLDVGEHPDAHDPVARGAMARGLAELIARSRPLATLRDLENHAMAIGEGQLWPIPHHERFDFGRTSAGAEWIDRIARSARRARDNGAGELVVGHCDWRAQNLRLAAERVSAVYDWDSVVLEREPILIGANAHLFTVNWAVPSSRQFPTADEALAFIRDYEAARDGPFTPDERRAAVGALVCAMAYTARCEHADAPLRPEDPGVAHEARAFLADHAQALLTGDAQTLVTAGLRSAGGS